MSSNQRMLSPSNHNSGLVDVDSILEHLGNGGRYQVIQLMLNIFASFLFAIPTLNIVFIGYQPDYQCSQVDNVTQLADYLPDDVTNVTLYDVQYHQCSIDVTVNTSGTSSTLSLPCVAGVNFSMPSYTSLLTEGMVHAAYTMFMELCPQQWRCLASVMDACLWALVCVLMASAAFCLQGLSWRHLSLALASPFLYALILPWFVDESLRWLLATGRMKEAENVLKKACRMNNKDFGQIQAMLHKQTFTNNLAKNGIRDQGLADSTNKNEDEATNKTKVKKRKMNGDITMEEKLDERAPLAEVNGEDGTKVTKNGDTHDRLSIDDTEGSSEDPLKPDIKIFYAKYTVLDLFRHRVVLVPFLICSFVWMTGNLYYYALLLGSATLSGDRFLNFALLNLQDIPSVLLALFLVHRWRRKGYHDTWHSSPVHRKILTNRILHSALRLFYGGLPYCHEGRWDGCSGNGRTTD